MNEKAIEAIKQLLRIIKQAVKEGYDIPYEQVEVLRSINSLVGIANAADTTKF
ncbi:hypothetical protein JCM15765_03770 [Paradesulfitobacterium aromaticivorans]